MITSLLIILYTILHFIVVVIPLLVATAYLTLAERKLLGAMQKRKGPNTVGMYGLLQPLADGIKLLLKETTKPIGAISILFYFAPLLTFAISLLSWVVIPFDIDIVIADIDLGILFLFAISSLGVYGIILAGWASNSQYGFLGALRSAAQLVSYEVSIGLILITILLTVGTLNLTEIVLFQSSVWFVIPFFPVFLMFFVSALAETNRPPFDLPEAEAELVAGYNVEYSAMNFALFFLGEYANMILMSCLTSLLFFGGWLGCFGFNHTLLLALKITFFLFLFIWIRAILPRYRYDQLMYLGWQNFLPLAVAHIVVVAGILQTFDGFFYY
jgi:NADH-quinone oxidoreductase subunit H